MDKFDDFGDQANRLLCGLIFAVQSSFLDYYLIFYRGNLWFLWIIVDLVIVGVLLYAFIVTYLYKRGNITRFLPYPCPGDLPFAYAVWIFYSVSLAIRTGILYKLVGPQLKTTDLFGPNMLQVSVALAVPFLYFTIKSLSLRKPGIQKQVTELCIFCEEILNIVDGIELLSILFSTTNTAKLAAGLPDAIIAFGVLSFIVPTINLAVYSISKYDANFGMSRIIRAIYVLAALFLINLPFFVMRFVIWSSASILSSLFIGKNAIFVIVHFLDIINIIIAQQSTPYEVNKHNVDIPMHGRPIVSPHGPTDNQKQNPMNRGDAPNSSNVRNQNNDQGRRRALPSAIGNQNATATGETKA